MNVTIKEEKKKRIVFEIEGESHTFCNMLKAELWNDPEVEVATYRLKHPLISKPEFLVETKGEEPRKAVLAACKRLHKLNASVAEKFNDALAR